MTTYANVSELLNGRKPSAMKKVELQSVVETVQERESVQIAADKGSDHLRHWALGGVGLMVVLSALLNGYANAQHATVYLAGWMMGLVIPCIVLLIFKVAGLLYKRQRMRGSYTMFTIGTGLLFLSVWHCSTSIALLTGSPLLLSLPMAIAIDCGLVGCEIAALVDG
jgi:hypothetical protein